MLKDKQIIIALGERTVMLNYKKIVSQKNRGFTFVEFVICFGIIICIAGGCVLSSKDYIYAAKVSAAKSDLNTISAALERYHYEIGRYPIALHDLTTRYNGYGPWLKESSLTDPWKSNYFYNCSDNGKYIIWSPGPDGKSEKAYTANSGNVTFSGDDIGIMSEK